MVIEPIDSFYTKPAGGKNPVQLRVHFARVLITDWLCARLQAAKKTEKTEPWTSNCLQSNSKTRYTQETILEKDKIRNVWQQNKSSNQPPRSDAGEVT